MGWEQILIAFTPLLMFNSRIAPVWDGSYNKENQTMNANTAITPSQQARLDGTAKRKPSKAEKQQALAKAKTPDPVKKADAPAKDAPAKEPKAKTSTAKRPPSATVIAWRAQKKFNEDQKITLKTASGNNPKSRGAAKKFEHYKNGMTVGEYIKVLKDKMGRTPAQTMDDIRWDFVAGFIDVK